MESKLLDSGVSGRLRNKASKIQAHPYRMVFGPL